MSRNAMQTQTYRPKDAGIHNTAVVSTMGLDCPEGLIYQRGRDWLRHQVCRHDTFFMVAAESYCASEDDIGYTRQEDYVKVNFWLSGRHTTILDGFGQHEHDRPEVFITSGVAGGLHLALQATLDPGDEAIFLDPYFVMYKHLTVLAGGKPVAVDSYPDFRFDPKRVEAMITPRTRVMMISSPF